MSTFLVRTMLDGVGCDMRMDSETNSCQILQNYTNPACDNFIQIWQWDDEEQDWKDIFYTENCKHFSDIKRILE